ncbi:CD209 antigen-like [Betta splendens]|uniref:CD209 antigen-like n=1 Tax=Betta splendens TaxID=158456 RepID=A0A9W2XJG9_BETSP|nr:CD209 antigen-like [Betta splendens]
MANLLGRKFYIPRFSKSYFRDNGLFQIFRQGASKRRVLLSLALLNAVMLTAAVVLGIKCARVKERSLHVPSLAEVQLVNALNNLRSNYSNITEAADEAKKTLKTVINNHAQLKTQIKLKSVIIDNYQKEIQTLRTESNQLQSNLTALEGTCGKCLPGWTLFNSSCYFFSYFESAAAKKTWTDSRADCVRRGADLVVIDSREEQNFVSGNIKSMRSYPNQWDNGVWVGLTDIDTEGEWVWINNVTEVEKRYWAYGEPNNHGRHGEDCAIVAYSSYSPWQTRFDGKCHEHLLAWTCETAAQ